MHGELLKARCLHCDAVHRWTDDLTPSHACPDCGRTGRLRPHVVWFGEMPFHLDEIDHAMRNADLFVAIGTSGAVYPAAGFVAEARAYGAPTCETQPRGGRQRLLLRRSALWPGERDCPGLG